MARWDGHDPRDESRLWPKVEVGLCWEWTGSLTSNGYGYIRWDRKFCRVHRVVWELLVGPLPEGLEPDHLCRNRKCCNPDHLEWVTHRENTLRGNSPHAISARKTQCPHGHLYDEKNTYVTPDGRRRCRKCLAAKARREMRRKRCRTD